MSGISLHCSWAVMRRGCGVVVRIIVRSFCADLCVPCLSTRSSQKFERTLTGAACVAKRCGRSR